MSKFAYLIVGSEYHAERGYRVLSETPAGSSLEQLARFWELCETRSARIAVAEQYHRYPELAAGLDAVARGRLGTPSSAYLSLAHDYHAASLLDMGVYLEGRPESYPLREALDDAYCWLLLQQAAAAPWTAVEAQRMTWNIK